MITKYITITPTNERSSEGYNTAVIACFNEFPCENPTKVWRIDAFRTEGVVRADFEAPSNSIRLWACSNNHVLTVDESYSPTITSLDKRLSKWSD